MEKRAKILNAITKFAVSFFAVLCAVLAITFACVIYFGGVNSETDIYTRQKVSHYLTYLIAPFVLFVLSALSAYIIERMFPQKTKAFIFKDKYYLSSRLKERVLPQAIKSERGLKEIDLKRKIFVVVCATVCIASGIYAVVFLFDKSIYERQPIEAMATIGWELVTFLVASFAFLIAFTLYNERLSEREIQILKKLSKTDSTTAEKVKTEKSTADNSVADSSVKDRSTADSQKTDTPKTDTQKTDNPTAEKSADVGSKPAIFGRYGKCIMQGVVFVTAVIFIVIGANVGGARDVLAKAIAICMECIGLA